MLNYKNHQRVPNTSCNSRPSLNLVRHAKIAHPTGNYIWKNKRAQVGETVSWIIATLVIIGILIIFIYISVLMAKVKGGGIIGFKAESEKGNQILSGKTLIAHNLADNKNREMIDKIIYEDEKK